MADPGSALSSFARLPRAALNLPYARILASLSPVLLLPLRIAYLPLPYLARLLAVLLAPALHLLSYLDAFTRRLASFLASLEPLYTFLGTAAAVGFVAGIALATTSSVITSYLDIRDSPAYPLHPKQDPDRQDAESEEDLSGTTAESEPRAPEPKMTSYHRHPPSPARRRLVSGLASQTILEEDDDSDEF